RSRLKVFACGDLGYPCIGHSRLISEVEIVRTVGSLPVITDKNGITFNDGSLPEVHKAARETLVNQVRQGILAEKLGFQSFWLTEHHFQPEGAEMSPNPLMVQMAVAAHTRRIRLGQAANIIVWHHPVRLAEQIALLDVISGGRVECGIGR